MSEEPSNEPAPTGTEMFREMVCYLIPKNEAKILIVDYIEDNRYTLERSLKRDGYQNISSIPLLKTNVLYHF